MAWIVDSMNTEIGFAVKHKMVTTVRGKFKTFTMDLNLDEHNPVNSRVSVEIDAASIDTGVDYRDNHLRSGDFFDVEHHAKITYKSKRVEKIDDTHFRVVGDLTMHGQTHELPLKFTVGGPFKNAMGLRAGAFSAKATISRKKWGLTWSMAMESGGMAVGDKVELSIQAEVMEPAQAPA